VAGPLSFGDIRITIMSEPSVVAIYLHRTTAGPMDPVESASAQAGAGLEGDTYFQDSNQKTRTSGSDREVTLIESEAVEAATRESGIPLSVAESRRNVVTRGVSLNALVGQEFEIGGVRLRGIRPCDPCSHLEALTRPGVLKALVNRGGLRAQVLEGGTIRVGDRVAVAPRV
jgi:MOSC domain-containing protein YiiM